jgi:hypothetical protein
MFHPINIPEYFIYDILYNDKNEIIILMAYEINPLQIEYIDNENKLTFNIFKCSHRHTIVYTLKTEYKETITLNINNNVIETKINKYPLFTNEIIFSTIVKDEDDYILQWITFHLSIGITRFIIYDNSNKNTLQHILQKYIENNTVVLIKWRYEYRLPISGLSAKQHNKIIRFILLIQQNTLGYLILMNM